uniref:Uncharacterized protein n=1 Tax=Tetranychus urticae TaxID=32264 RepID=T1KFK0_TETUR
MARKSLEMQLYSLPGMLLVIILHI